MRVVPGGRAHARRAVQVPQRRVRLAVVHDQPGDQLLHPHDQDGHAAPGQQEPHRGVPGDEEPGGVRGGGGAAVQGQGAGQVREADQDHLRPGGRVRHGELHAGGPGRGGHPGQDPADGGHDPAGGRRPGRESEGRGVSRHR